MQPDRPRPGRRLPASPDFLITLAVIGSVVACAAVLVSDSASERLRYGAMWVFFPAMAVLLVGVWGTALAFPLWAMWKGARAADARRPPPTGTLTVAPDEGPLAPAALPKERPVAHHWGSREWVFSGLGIVGEVGGVACLVLGWTTAAQVFGAMFAVGAGGWVWALNQEERRRFRGGDADSSRLV